jgi:hypothetical protein
LPKADQKPTRRFAGDLKYFFNKAGESPARKSGKSGSKIRLVRFSLF